MFNTKKDIRRKMKKLTIAEMSEEMYNVKILAAIGLYKTESEWMKKGIRQLRLGRVKGAKEIREILDRALGKEELSSVIRRMREEELD
jgi:hypothetical protein